MFDLGIIKDFLGGIRSDIRSVGHGGNHSVDKQSGVSLQFPSRQIVALPPDNKRFRLITSTSIGLNIWIVGEHGLTYSDIPSVVDEVVSSMRFKCSNSVEFLTYTVKVFFEDADGKLIELNISRPSESISPMRLLRPQEDYDIWWKLDVALSDIDLTLTANVDITWVDFTSQG